MARRSALRASDSDRDRVAERLREATGEGRLRADELEDRLGVAFSARTYGELDALVADLPGPVDRRRHTPLLLRGALALVALLAALAVLVAVALVIVGVVAAWGVWLLLAWLIIGRHHRTRGRRRVGYSRACPPPARRGSAWL
jgi:fatty acid desaturase